MEVLGGMILFELERLMDGEPLHHTGEEMVAVDLLPEVKGGVLPVELHKAQVSGDDVVPKRHFVVEGQVEGVAVAVFDQSYQIVQSGVVQMQLVQEVDNRNDAQGRAVILRSPPFMTERGAVDLEFRLAEVGEPRRVAGARGIVCSLQNVGGVEPV